MQYVLKNKDKEVLKFEVKTTIKHFNKEKYPYSGESHNAEITNINIVDENILPLNIDKNDIKKSLESWITNRKVPKNRAYVEKIIETYTNDNTQDSLMDYIDVSLALSLNDSYWVIPANSDYSWKDYNLYQNEFDKALSLVAFSGISHKVKNIVTSPEYSTNGMLKKCWYRDNGAIYLYKGSSEKYANGGRESYSEFYMTQIAQIMGFSCIDYDLKLFHNEIISICPIFTNENEGYMPIYQFLNKTEMLSKDLELINSIARIYGKDKLDNLMLFDALIYNTDRHLGNFGMIVDNNTNKILRPAPIFDNGFSMINYLTENELKSIDTALKEKISSFGFLFDKQLEIALQPRHLESLNKLKTFEFKKHKDYNLPDSFLEPINKHINKRAEFAINLCLQKEKEINKSKNLN